MKSRFNFNECDIQLDLDVKEGCTCTQKEIAPIKNEKLVIPLDAVIKQCDEFFANDDLASLGEHLRFWRNEVKNINDIKSELSIINELIGHYRMTNNKEEGLKAVDSALKILDDWSSNLTPNLGTIILNAATALSAFGNYEQAFNLYKRTEEIYNASLETKLELFAGLWNNMAYTFEKIGDSNGAQKAYEKAIEVLSRLSMFSDLAVSYVNLAGLYFNTLNNKEKAMEYLTLALDIFNSNALIKDSYYAHTCKKCAGAFTDMGYPEIAEDLQKRANEIYERNQQK